MEGLANDSAREQRLAMFYRHLCESGLRAEQVSKISTSLRYFFEVAGYSTEFFDGPVAKRGRAASARSIPEKIAYLKKQESRQILPLGMDAILHLRSRLWVKSSWLDRKGMDAKGQWIAIGLGFDSGSRISSVTRQDGLKGANHCIKAGDCSFTIRDILTGHVTVAPGGDRARQALASSSASVTEITMKYWTSKTAEKTAVLQASDNGDVLLLNDLTEWVLKSGVEEHENLTTRHWVTGDKDSSRTTIRRDIREQIKITCRALGLNPLHFATKSLRSGFTTQYGTSGYDPRERNARGGWAKKSVVPDTNYDFTVGKGAFSVAASSGVSLTVNDMKRLVKSRKKE
jgi:hypothetical protein